MVKMKHAVPHEWTWHQLSEFLEFKNGISWGKESYGSGVKFVNVLDVLNNTFITSSKIIGSVSLELSKVQSSLVTKGDILFNRTSETAGEIGLTSVYLDDAPAVFGGFVIRARPKRDLLLDSFKKYCFLGSYFRKQVVAMGQGAIRTNIGQCDLEKAWLLVPPQNEQKKVAEVIEVFDKAIETTRELISEKGVLRAALMQQLLTGKKRLPGFNNKWKTKALKEALVPASRPVGVPDSTFLGLGIRSHGKGTFLKHEFDPSKIEMDTLYEVRENDLIVNITFAWEGAIAIAGPQDHGALVSHRFPTFTFNSEEAIVDYFRYIILQPRFKYLLGLISPGGAGRNRVLSKTDFLKLELKLPGEDEQIAIATVLKSTDAELDLLRQKLEALREQKRGLMQKLLIGQIRVKTS